MANMYLDICLSDIPRERIKTAANGKKYLKAIIRPRQGTDRDGYDHYIAAWVPRDQRNDDDRPAFIGRAQDKDAQQQEQQPRQCQQPSQRPDRPVDPNDDLPF